MNTLHERPPSPEALLWQEVVYHAFRDATRISCKMDQNDYRAKREADCWIKDGGRNYRFACVAAGLDPDFLRDAYLGGRVNADALRKSEGNQWGAGRKRRRRAG